MFIGRTYVPTNNTYGGGGGGFEIDSLASVFMVISLGLCCVALLVCCVFLATLFIDRLEDFSDKIMLACIVTLGGSCLFLVAAVVALLFGL